MKFEWNEQKRLINLQRHGIDFEDVWRVFEIEIYTTLDDRFDYGEVRWLSYGLLLGEVVAVSYTAIDETIRIISVRKGEKNEQTKYFKEVRD